MKVVPKVSLITLLLLVCAIDLNCERAPSFRDGEMESKLLTADSDESAVPIPSTVQKLQIGMSIHEVEEIVGKLEEDPRYAWNAMRAKFPQGALLIGFNGFDDKLNGGWFNAWGKPTEPPDPEEIVSKTFILSEQGWELQD